MLQGCLVGIEKSIMTFYPNGRYDSTSQTLLSSKELKKIR